MLVVLRGSNENPSSKQQQIACQPKRSPVFGPHLSRRWVGRQGSQEGVHTFLILPFKEQVLTKEQDHFPPAVAAVQQPPVAGINVRPIQRTASQVFLESLVREGVHPAGR